MMLAPSRAVTMCGGTPKVTVTWLATVAVTGPRPVATESVAQMGDLPSPASPLVLHMETRAVPAAHREFDELARKTADAFASKDVQYATYKTVIGDPNITHRFS